MLIYALTLIYWLKTPNEFEESLFVQTETVLPRQTLLTLPVQPQGCTPLKEYTGLLTLVSRVIMIATGRSAVRLARSVRDAEVGGSNPLAPTLIFAHIASLSDSTRFACSHRAFCSPRDRLESDMPLFWHTSSIWENLR